MAQLSSAIQPSSVIRTARLSAGRLLGAVFLLTGLVVSGHPPTANATPPADALVLSLQDVDGITGASDLAVDPTSDVHQPRTRRVSDSCPVLNDQGMAFGSTFTQFKSVAYTGSGNRAVTQTVAMYPSSDAARMALKNLYDALTACANQRADFTLQKLDFLTLAVCFTQCSTLYRVASSVLIGVDAAHFGDSDRIATAVLKQISDRVGPG